MESSSGIPWLWVTILILIILFCGEPDLMDAILYKLTNGEIKFPK